MTSLCITALVYLFNFAHDDLHELKLNLWYLMVITVFVRLLDAIYWKIQPKGPDYNPAIALWRFSIGSLTTAIVWGLYTLLLYDHMDTLELATTMIIISSLAGGATNVLAPNKPLALTYISILILPLVIMAINDPRSSFIMIGALGILFWLSMISSSTQSNRFFMRAIMLKHENQILAQQMLKERNETVAINNALVESNRQLDIANATLEAKVTRRTHDIHRLSNRDPLTSLLNRTGFLQHFNSLLQQASTNKSSFAILFIDLDGFKRINDNLGHQAGDLVLIEVAKRLSSFCEEEHLARWGGDEFVLIIPYANADTAQALAQVARNSLLNTIDIKVSQVNVDATIGITLYPQHSRSAAELIRLADITMYQKKRTQAGGHAFFNENILAQMHKEQELIDGLKKAISRQQFSLVYQPIINTSDHSIWGVEVLLRWQFFDQNIGPDVFIPLAEKTGLIFDIGNWVLNRACIDAEQWPFSDIAICINVSVPQLLDDKFIFSVNQALQRSKLASERLHIEITESVFAENKVHFVNQLSALKALNIQLSIDDFGTGFSSLSQLELLSFDHIKIDKSFVQSTEESSNTIIRATILMAQELGAKTIAEGIETIDHANRLRAMGVDCLQGYYYAKPLPARKLLQWYQNYNE
jgi:diguanylate cyclase (GGDEF)-like protein